MKVKKHVAWGGCLILLMCFPAGHAWGETAADFAAVPPFVVRGLVPNVMLNLSVESPMQGAAYNDQREDVNGDGDFDDPVDCGGRRDHGMTVQGVCYSPQRTYVGLFDPDKEYHYDDTNEYFYPVGRLNPDHSLRVNNSGFSGNYLNWATMTAIDEFRWALTGGNRVVDTTTETVVERANVTLGPTHSWFPVKAIGTGVSGTVPAGTVTRWSNDQVHASHPGGDRVSFFWGDWWDGRSLKLNMRVRVKVCDPLAGLESNCEPYNGGAYYKPEGLIQRNSNRMRFAVMSYTLDNSQHRDGGVLRSNMKFVGPLLPDGTANPEMEWGADGILIDDPDTDPTTSAGGVINYVNRFGAGGYKSFDPVSELFYECLNYYKNRGPTPEYSTGLTVAQADGYPVITAWDDPIQGWCQPNYIVGINDANPWLDKQLPGTHFTTSRFDGTDLLGEDWGEPGNADPDYSVRDLTDTVGELQGISGTSRRIGCVPGNCDQNADKQKVINHLGRVMGTAPYAPKQNSYYLAGLSYYANTQDIRSDLPGKQTVKTFMIDTQEFNTNPLIGQMNMLWLAGKYGGFSEQDHLDTNSDGNDEEPNLAAEWDSDGDGEPDNYVLATNPEKLIAGLTQAFSDLGAGGAGATAAAVLSGSRSGEGAVYQSVFFPELSDNAMPANTIHWAGDVHAMFADSEGRMREDSNNNSVLDDDDKRIVYRKLADDSVVVDKYSIHAAVAEETGFTNSSPASVLNGKYFFLNTVEGKFYVWFDVDDTGTDPAPSVDREGIRVLLDSSDNNVEVTTKIASTLGARPEFSASSSLTVLTVTNRMKGDVPDATAETSGIEVSVLTQGIGVTEQLDITGSADNIAYLWSASSWLNAITDTDITDQRTYDSADAKRYIFSFVDADENMAAGPGEQVDFVSSALPNVADLKDSETIYPYIPVYADSESLPSYVDLSGGNRDEFLQHQTQRVINYIRGQEQELYTLTTGAGGNVPAFRSRRLDTDGDGTLDTTWRLGDIVYSSPVVVGKPGAAFHLKYGDLSYADFASKYHQRRTVLYAGGNDGIFHAFNSGFYEDRFDVHPMIRDGIKDVQYLKQPKDNLGNIITTVTDHELGAELWGYIPYNLLPHLYWLTEPDYKHVYYNDLKPWVFDAQVFAEEGACTDPVKGLYHDDCVHPHGWGTILVGGMRFGGGKLNVDMDRTDGNVDSDDRSMQSAYFMVDVTNPEKEPLILGELSFPTLGYTVSQPTVALFKDRSALPTYNDWYLIFGSGPAEIDGAPGVNSRKSLGEGISEQKAKLFVVDLKELVQNGVVKTVNSTGGLTDTAPFHFQEFEDDENAFISSPVSVDYDFDYNTDAVYFGTASHEVTGTPPAQEWGGKMRRVVMENNRTPSSWIGDSVLIDLEARKQPIIAPPTIGTDREGNNRVYFGTGRYLLRKDAENVDQQTFYGIKEPLHAPDPMRPDYIVKSYEEVQLTDLYESTNIEVETGSGVVKNSPTATPPGVDMSWSDFVRSTKNEDGWFYELDQRGERSFEKPSLFGGLVNYTTYTPSNDVCAFEGTSDLYALYYLTGTAYAEPTIISATNPNPPLHLKKISLGSGLSSAPAVHSGQGGKTTVFTQGSSADISTIEEIPPETAKSGKVAWGYK